MIEHQAVHRLMYPCVVARRDKWIGYRVFVEECLKHGNRQLHLRWPFWVL